MARKVKFPLKMADGAEVRTIDELKEHFDVESVVGYFSDGRLLTWLQSRYYDEEADKVAALDKGDTQIHKKLCAIFGVESEEEVDPEKIARRQKRLNLLKQYTDDKDILERVDLVAFDQEDLGDLLDEDKTLIYLCANRFTIPLRVTDKTYVGIGKAIAIIRSKELVDFDKLNIKFRGVHFDDDYQKIVDAPPVKAEPTPAKTKPKSAQTEILLPIALSVALDRAEHFKKQFMQIKKLLSQPQRDIESIKEELDSLAMTIMYSKRYPKEMRLIGDCYKEIGFNRQANNCFYSANNDFSAPQTSVSYTTSTRINTYSQEFSLSTNEHSITAPNSGRVERIFVEENQAVRAGDLLLTFNASYSGQRSITAFASGTVKRIKVKEGQYVNAHDSFMTLSI